MGCVGRGEGPWEEAIAEARAERAPDQGREGVEIIPVEP